MNQYPDNSTEPPGAVISSTLMVEETLNVAHVARRATRGAAALAVRQVLVYGSNISGSIVLARVLPASDFGYYAIVVFAVNFLNIFAGTGFASNLIRMPMEPTLSEKRAVFTSQQAIICLIFGFIWIVAPLLGSVYHLDAHGGLFFRLMGVGLVLTSLMVIPQVQMERELAFDKLALIEVCQAVVFNATAIVLALKGVGYISFAIALVLRTAVGAVMALIISPWSLGFQLRSVAIREHLHFGFALQAGQLLAVARDSLTPVFVGMYLGAADVGYITWAVFLAGYAVLLITPLQRLYLPLFAKVQGNSGEMARFVDRAMWAVHTVAAPITTVTLGLLTPITVLVFGHKWLYAMPLVYCFAFGNLFVPSASPMLAALNALGKSKTTLAVTALSMVVIWGVGIPLIVHWGIWGFGLATIPVNLLNLLLYWIVWREIGLNPWTAYWPTWPLAAMSFVIARGLCHVHEPSGFPCLAAYGIITLGSYAVAVWFTSERRVRALVQLMRPATGALEVIA